MLHVEFKNTSMPYYLSFRPIIRSYIFRVDFKNWPRRHVEFGRQGPQYTYLSVCSIHEVD